MLQKVTLGGIGGCSGKAEAVKVLEPLVHSLISPKMLAATSWSGKGKPGEKKIPLSQYQNIIHLISTVCREADDSYTHMKCVDDLKYRILKYAVGKYADISRSSS